MTFLLVFLTTLAVAFWVILRVFRGKSVTGGSLTGLSSGFSNLTGSLFAKGWVRPVAIIGGFVLLFLFWDSVKVGFAEWLANSDAGTTLGFEADMIKKWLWVVVVIAVILFIFWRIPNPIWAQLISAVVAVMALSFIALSLVTGETLFSLTNGDAAKRQASGLACASQKELMNVTIDRAGRDITVCPEKGRLFLFPERGTRLVVDFSPKFKRDYEHLLQGRSLQDFVGIHAPKTYPGSLAESWMVIPLQSQPQLRFVSAWDKSGLKDITLTVRAE